MVTVFWDDKGIILLDFLEHGHTVNSEHTWSYCEQWTHQKFRETTGRKRSNKNLEVIHIIMICMTTNIFCNKYVTN